ncbi:MAG: flagellar basal body rod protein FlgC [Firmicutes bacterium]|nr:flagellar basal body rod protein FlgC [Bacillota bacterium]
MGLFDSFSISASGMTANRYWADLISNNVANINTTGTPGDPANRPYQRQVPVFDEILRQKLLSKDNTANHGGVRVSRLVNDNNEPRLVHDPSHPHADPQTGYVAYPNINILNEMINLMAASRAYEANVTTLEAAKSMSLAALDMGR